MYTTGVPRGLYSSKTRIQFGIVLFGTFVNKENGGSEASFGASLIHKCVANFRIFISWLWVAGSWESRVANELEYP